MFSARSAVSAVTRGQFCNVLRLARAAAAATDVHADLLGVAGSRFAERARQVLVRVDDAAIFHDREIPPARGQIGRAHV